MVQIHLLLIQNLDNIYLEELTLLSNCSVAECFPEKFSSFWNDQVCALRGRVY